MDNLCYAINGQDFGADTHVEIEAGASVAGVWSSNESCSTISPPTKYGSPQLANETYGPRSKTMISHSSQCRLARAAALAPPATPPTMIIRLLFIPLLKPILLGISDLDL